MGVYSIIKKKETHMWSKREIIIFFAGAEAFHTLVHIFFSFAVQLPIQVFTISLTPQLNMFAIVLNLIITIGLIWWANSLK